MGGGMPIGGVVASNEMMIHFARNPALGHITTFGGHPVCVAAALATLKLLIDETYIAEIEKSTLKKFAETCHDQRSAFFRSYDGCRNPRSIITYSFDRQSHKRWGLDRLFSVQSVFLSNSTSIDHNRPGNPTWCKHYIESYG